MAATCFDGMCKGYLTVSSFVGPPLRPRRGIMIPCVPPLARIRPSKLLTSSAETGVASFLHSMGDENSIMGSP